MPKFSIFTLFLPPFLFLAGYLHFTKTTAHQKLRVQQTSWRFEVRITTLHSVGSSSEWSLGYWCPREPPAILPPEGIYFLMSVCLSLSPGLPTSLRRAFVPVRKRHGWSLSGADVTPVQKEPVWARIPVWATGGFRLHLTWAAATPLWPTVTL